MNKQEYLAALDGELKKKGVPDAEEIVFEYEQHFAFKLADGYAEEEIAKKLGEPSAIAAQFAQDKIVKRPKAKRALLTVWFAFLGLFEAALYGAFAAFVLGVFVSAIGTGVVGACLIGRINYAHILPSMPYAGAFLLGLCCLALAVILGVAGVWCAASLRQIVRASARYKKNALNGGALPPLPYSPQFAPRTRRRLRGVLTGSVAVFGVAFVAGFAALALLSGALGFWHAYGWFVS